MKIYVLPFGRLIVPQSLIYGNDFPADKTAVVPMYGVLINHPDGIILFDTGLVLDDGIDDTYRKILEFTEEDLIVNRLKSIGLSTEDIEYLVISHLHSDHAGNIHKFKNAKVFVNKEDFVNTMVDYGLSKRKLPKLPPQYVDTWIKNKPKWYLIEESKIDLLPGVTLYSFGPGHTYGMTMLMVKTEKSGTILMVQDLIFSKKLMNDQKLPGIIYDEVGYFDAVTQIKDLAKRENAVIWFGHDTDQFANLKHAPNGFYE